jgi:hypothetical protein
MPSPGVAQPARDDGRPPQHRPAMSKADLRVVIWYARARPLETFDYRVYDLRKGEYTPRVDDWLALVRRQYPGYAAYTRDVDLARERGATDRLKAGSAVLREFYVLAAERGYDLSPLLPSRRGTSAPPSMPHALTPLPQLRLPEMSPATTPLLPEGSPFPYPYPRPHP